MYHQLLVGLAVVLFLLFFNEFVVYIIVLSTCRWSREGLPANSENLKVMFLADTHLLGPYRGHWFDKLRREWQMRRAFQTAVHLLKPDAVFFLGDIFDEGEWVTDKEFNIYMDRFNDMFRTPKHVSKHVVVGNHDIGFHYSIRAHMRRRFEKAFDTPSVQLVELSGNYFVKINSMSLHGDACDLCSDAKKKIEDLAEVFQCLKRNKTECFDRLEEEGSTLIKLNSYTDKLAYSKPVLLQHFPLFRNSEAECEGDDSAPEEIRHKLFRPQWDCLSESSTDYLIKTLSPRVVFSGHTHHGCYSLHPSTTPEWTLPSFSWRNKNNPSFTLAVFAPNHFTVSKCAMPLESSVYAVYFLGGSGYVIWLIIQAAVKRRPHLKVV